MEGDGLGAVGVGVDHVGDGAGVEQRDLADRGEQEAVAELALIDVVDADQGGVAGLLEVEGSGRHDDLAGCAKSGGGRLFAGTLPLRVFRHALVPGGRPARFVEVKLQRKR